jgi:DNA-binding PadR family transcriptional regulator
LILGVLRVRQPTHGYDIRKELESWRADQWSNIAYGSIYHALSSMSREGLVEQTKEDLGEKRPARISYTITDRGEKEFRRLLSEQWWDPSPPVDPFQVALTFMDAMPRDEMLAALRHRLNLMRSTVEVLEYLRKSALEGGQGPRHIAENFRLEAIITEAYARWIEEAIQKVESGELP